MFLPLSRQIVDSLPEDPFEAILAIIQDFRREMAVVEESFTARELRDRQRYEIARQVCALLAVFLKREGFAIIIPQLPYEKGQIGGERARAREEAVTQVIRFINRLEIDIQAQRQLRHSENLEEAYSTALGPALQIEFSPQDLHHLQELLASLRDLVSIAPDVPSDHRRRFLKRIDRLMVELGRETHDLSLFWGFVAEMSLVFRAPNKDAALLAPRMKTLMQIVWSAQAKMFGRPSNTPLRLLGQDI